MAAEQSLDRRGGEDEPDAVLGRPLAEEQPLLGDGQCLVEPARLDEHLGEVGERATARRAAPRASRRASSPLRSTEPVRAPAAAASRSDAALLTSPGSATWARWRARLGRGAPSDGQGRRRARMRPVAVRRPAGSRRPRCGSPGAGRRAAWTPARHAPARRVEQLVDRSQPGSPRSSPAVTAGEVGVERVAEHRAGPDQRERVVARGRPARRTRPRRRRSGTAAASPLASSSSNSGLPPELSKIRRAVLGRAVGADQRVGRGAVQGASSSTVSRPGQPIAPRPVPPSAMAPGRAATTSRCGPSRRSPDQRLEELPRERVGPVGVVQDEDQRTGARQRLGHAAEQLPARLGVLRLTGPRSGIASRNTASGMSDSSSVARPVSTSKRRDVACSTTPAAAASCRCPPRRGRTTSRRSPDATASRAATSSAVSRSRPTRSHPRASHPEVPGTGIPRCSRPAQRASVVPDKPSHRPRRTT